MNLMFPIYFLSLILSAGMTLLSAHQILELSDLDCDYTNPRLCCYNLNKVVLPEMIGVGLLVAINLASFNWLPVATTSPMLFWLIYTYRSAAPRGYTGMFDPTEICDQNVLNKHVRRCLFKIGFHFVHFLCYMYFAIIAIITS